MSITNPYLGTIPGAGGSFPMAGVRPKQKKIQIFTTSTVWTCPPNVTEVEITMCGGGGGGGGGATTVVPTSQVFNDWMASSGGAGGGGGGGLSVIKFPIPVIPLYNYTITIGAGGSGGARATTPNGVAGSAGTSGGTTSINGGIIHIYAGGGAAGSGGQYTTGGSRGGGASVTITYNTWANRSDYAIRSQTAASQVSFIAGSDGGNGTAGLTPSLRTVTAYGTLGTAADVQHTVGGSRGTIYLSPAVVINGPPGSGGGASFYGRGGTGAPSLAYEYSRNPTLLNSGGIISSSTAGLSPSQSYAAGYPGFGGGGGGGAGGLAVGYYDEAGSYDSPAIYNFAMTGSNGGNGSSGVVILEWEE